jgi:hypothetical protein
VSEYNEMVEAANEKKAYRNARGEGMSFTLSEFFIRVLETLAGLNNLSKSAIVEQLVVNQLNSLELHGIKEELGSKVITVYITRATFGRITTMCRKLSMPRAFFVREAVTPGLVRSLRATDVTEALRRGQSSSKDLSIEVCELGGS